MSDGNRNRHDTIVAFAVVVCLLIVGLIGWYEGFQKGQESHQGYSAQSYQDQADRQIAETCSSFTGTAMGECVAEAIRSAREQQRAEEDLDAQQQMAEWAKWMLIATVVMAAVTLFGVVFVWQTLVATQDMARDARKIGEAQSRAYVDVASLTLILSKGDPQRHEIHVVVRNTGLTPCLKYGLRAKLAFFENSGSAPFNVQATGMHVYASIAPQSIDEVCYFPFIDPSIGAVMGNVEEGYSFVVDGTVTYRTLYGEKYETDFSFLAKSNGRDVSNPISVTKFSRGKNLYSRVKE